jgi:hypothetical protein
MIATLTMATSSHRQVYPQALTWGSISSIDWPGASVLALSVGPSSTKPSHQSERLEPDPLSRTPDLRR